jgi:hypothetical protein
MIRTKCWSLRRRSASWPRPASQARPVTSRPDCARSRRDNGPRRLTSIGAVGPRAAEPYDITGGSHNNLNHLREIGAMFGAMTRRASARSARAAAAERRREGGGIDAPYPPEGPCPPYQPSTEASSRKCSPPRTPTFPIPESRFFGRPLLRHTSTMSVGPIRSHPHPHRVPDLSAASSMRSPACGRCSFSGQQAKLTSGLPWRSPQRRRMMRCCR